MKNLMLLLLVSSTTLFAIAQQTPPSVPPNATIERVDLSGLDTNRLSVELRADIQKLVGQTYNAQTIDALTQDIQVELPEYVAAATTQPGSQPDRVRVVLVVAKISDNDALKANINSRYIVDAIDFEGIKVQIGGELDAELQKMVGGNVDSEQLGKLGDRISRENPALNAIVTWKLRRSSAPQHVRVVYDVRMARNTLSLSLSGGTYHSRQGFSAPIFTIGYTFRPVGTLNFWMLNSAADRIERDAGYGVGYSRGTPRIRLNLNYSSYRAQWKNNTLESDLHSSKSPGLYRLRDTLSGSVSFSHPLRSSTLMGVTTGLEFSELQMQTPTLGFQKSNAFTGSLNLSYARNRSADLNSHRAGGSYQVHTGTGALDSDFIYTRHTASVYYTFTHGPHSIDSQFQAGKITGTAPMYERFSLGDSRTLRGWSKYEINPLGGNRILYASAAYNYKVLTGFYDVGSVWDAGQAGITRQSAGVRVGKRRCTRVFILPDPQCLSVTVGFPINGERNRPALILGMGF